jgi:succinyl-CoA synthetase beta subunit
MKIHEYQGKEILRNFGVPVPRGIPAFTVQEAVEAAQKLGGPVWVVKAQIHAGGRGKGGGVKVAKSVDDVKRLAGEILGMQLKTHQTGPEGQKVRRLYIEDGADIQKEYYLSVVTDRATQKIAFIASSEGGMDIEEVAHSTPEKIITVFVDPLVGLTQAQGEGDRPRHRHAGRLAGAVRRHLPEALQVLHGHGCLAGRDQPAEPRRQGQRGRPGLQVQLRQQRAVPPPRDRRPA